MIMLNSLLVEPAKQANIKVPDNIEEYDPQEYPHFHVYCTFQINRPIPTPTSIWTNAEVVANIPESQIREITFNQIVELGVI